MAGREREREREKAVRCTRSHFQVGFRTVCPLEGTSNDSDIAAREFKSLTPSGSLSVHLHPRLSTGSTYTLRHPTVLLYLFWIRASAWHRWAGSYDEREKRDPPIEYHTGMDPVHLNFFHLKLSLWPCFDSRHVQFSSTDTHTHTHCCLWVFGLLSI